MLNRVLLYCRPGFEGECVAEITDRAAELNIFGFGKTQPQSGFVNFECYTPSDAIKLVKQLPFRSLIFARQFFVAGNEITLESLENRIDPIIAQMSREIPLGGNLQVEAPDSEEGRALLTFCRKFSVPFRQKLRQLKRLTVAENNKKPTIHLFFTDNRHCYLGYSLPNNHSPFYMGIPRLKFPSDAPSRSTLKLEEAFHLFVPYEEWDDRLKGGLYAVDLGACPGGWTYQLVKRSMFVFAIDNGAMAPSLMETGQVKHYQEDGFKFEPERKNIYWLVCDMVEKPSKVSALMAKWLIEGWCREAIFNLKLPMKKRYDEVMENLNWIKTELTAHNVNFQIQAKHLYHDREEVTVHIQRIWG